VRRLKGGRQASWSSAGEGGAWHRQTAGLGTRPDTRGCVSLALVGQVSVHMVYSHVANVRRQTKMHDFFTVPNH